jgi:hypothetical protein
VVGLIVNQEDMPFNEVVSKIVVSKPNKLILQLALAK